MSARTDPGAFLATLPARAPEMGALIEQLRSQYLHKLWHQLTGTLFQILDTPPAKALHVEIFENFVRPIGSKLNQLRFAELAVKTSQQISDPTRHVQFLVDSLSQLPKDDHPEAYVRVLSTVAHAKLLYGDLEGTKIDLDVCSGILDNLDGVDPSVHAAFYGVASDFYKAKADYGSYYKHSLLYLACVNPETDMSSEDRVSRAHDLGISALLGANIYNFGELLMHPILASLENTPHEWLKTLLFVFNEGNIGKFESLAPLFPKEVILQENHAFLRQKICLMALMEGVFKRATNKRTMSFQEIAEETKLPLDEVEHLLMKALRLIRGSMDQVDQLAKITWVQPRVLSLEQIGRLAERLTSWCERLSGVETVVQHASPDLLSLR